MQDYPTYQQLLEAVAGFLEAEIVPSAPGARGFHARVAANVLRIVRRELETEEQALADEWRRLDDLLGTEPKPPTLAALRDALRRRTEELCARIRAGEADSGEWAGRVFDHVRRTVRDKLAVSSPALLERDAV
jgi:hypothetical protein